MKVKADRDPAAPLAEPGSSRPSPEAGPARRGLAIRRGIDVLSAFRRGDAGLGNAELAERTGLTRPTVSRITYTLAIHGYLSFDAGSYEYRLGPRVAAIGLAALAAMDVRATAAPLMRRLAEHSGFNIGLGARDRLRMVCTDACEGSMLVGLRLFAGTRIPILTTAMGRAWLGALDDVGRETLAQAFRAHGEDGERVMAVGAAAAAQLRDQGFCVSAGDWHQDIHGVAAPIRHTGGRLFAVTLGGPAYSLPHDELLGRHGPQVAALAQRVEALLSDQAGS
jgi:DNA-binding IclR family transcriptional regulator